MCGFVGFTNYIKDTGIVLEQMMDSIAHRGPDSAGCYIDSDIALGFRRLSIIDLAEGNQPMFNEYIQLHDIFSPLIKDKGLYGLCFVRKLFMVIFGYLPKRFTYFILKTIL